MKAYIVGLLMLLGVVTISKADDDFLPPEPPGDEIPVDGGVGFLLAAGTLWGIKKLKEKK